MRHLSVLIVVFCACGSKPATTTGGGTARGPSCPAAFGAVQEGQDCAEPDSTCTFPEGNCSCVRGEYCGGTPPGPARIAQLQRLRWHCVPKRTDGCPESVPGGACTTEGLECTYGGCCPDVYQCTAGTWTRHETACAP